MNVDASRIRSIDPLVSPQYPFNEAPKPPERSEPRYATFADYEARIPMRDGVRLAADVIRPHAGGMKFPALVTTSVYTRQIQRSVWPICNVFRPGHRIRLEIGNADSITASQGKPHVTIRNKAKNTIHEGGRKPSRLVIPVIPR